MSENLTELREELLAAKAILDPQCEGLDDLNRLNLLAPSKLHVTAAAVIFKRRLAKVVAALAIIRTLRDTLADLEKDGFPEVPNYAVPPEVFDDLKGNVDTVSAAFRKFTTDQATTLDAKVGEPRLKSEEAMPPIPGAASKATSSGNLQERRRVR